jgi:uncharacterized integral membrane protein
MHEPDMRVLTRLAQILALVLLFLLLLGFALKNTELVAVRYFLGREWRAPLSLVLLVFFGAGAVLGVLASLSVAYRQRRELVRLRRRSRFDSQSGDAPRRRPLPETPIV